MPTLDEQVSKRMEELGWMHGGKPNAKELERRAEIGYATAHDIIKGDVTPELDTLRKVARALKVSVAWLLGEDETFDLRAYERGREDMARAVSEAIKEQLERDAKLHPERPEGLGAAIHQSASETADGERKTGGSGKKRSRG